MQVLRWNFHVTEQKITFLFPERPFSPNNSLSGRNFIQVSYNIPFYLFWPWRPPFLSTFKGPRIKQCKYHLCKTVLTIIDFKAQQGKIGQKKYTSSPWHVILNCLSPTTQRENNRQCNFAYLCKLSLLSLSFTIPHKQQYSLPYSVGVLLPPLKSP